MHYSSQDQYECDICKKTISSYGVIPPNWVEIDWDTCVCSDCAKIIRYFVNEIK